MTSLLTIALVLSLLGIPLLLLTARGIGVASLDLRLRIAFWYLTAGVLLLVWAASPDPARQLGLVGMSIGAVGWAVVACVAILGAFPLQRVVQQRLGAGTTEQIDRFQEIVQRSLAYRMFLVLTAAVVEEVLYRGVGTGVGAQLVGGILPAAILSLVVFTVAHLRWGWAHLLSVLWAGGVLTLLFVITNSLLACIVVHAIVDGVGFILVPIAVQRAKAAGGGA